MLATKEYKSAINFLPELNDIVTGYFRNLNLIARKR
jgi:hypothetical protein